MITNGRAMCKNYENTRKAEEVCFLCGLSCWVPRLLHKCPGGYQDWYTNTTTEIFKMFEYFKRNKRLPQQKVLNIMCRFKTILYVLLCIVNAFEIMRFLCPIRRICTPALYHIRRPQPRQWRD
jgi:hypothetical protein